MSVFAIGLSHATAPIAVRERLAFTPDELPGALLAITRDAGIAEAAILSTCNRVEIYTVGESDASHLIEWLALHRHLTRDELAQCLYIKHDLDAVRHVMRVAAGLDSMVLGEPQILGQLKDAYASAKAAGTVGSQLSRLFQQTFAVAKQVRTDTSIGASAVSVAYAAVQLAKRIFSDLSQTTVLFIGAGETIALCAQHLHQQGAGKMIVANRSVARAQELALRFGAEAITLSDLHEHLPRADIIISSTASSLPILGKGAVERAIKQRKHKPMFMVDLAVPRDIEPEVADLDDVFLYSVDDLNGVVQENLKSRQHAALQAEEMIASHVDNFQAWQRTRDAGSTIHALRASWAQVQEEELQRALARLRAGDGAEAVLQQMAYRLGNKYLHAPSEALRLAAGNSDTHTLELIRRVFDLDASS